MKDKFANGEYILCPHCDYIALRDELKEGIVKGNKKLCYNCGNVFRINWLKEISESDGKLYLEGEVNDENINGNADIQ